MSFLLLLEIPFVWVTLTLMRNCVLRRSRLRQIDVATSSYLVQWWKRASFGLFTFIPLGSVIISGSCGLICAGILINCCPRDEMFRNECQSLISKYCRSVMFPACRCVRCVGSFKSDRPYFDHNLASHDRPNRFILPVCTCVLEEHVLTLFPSPSLSCSLKIILSFATFSADLHALSSWLKTAVHYDLLHALAAHPHPPPPSSCPLLR